ncbi:type IV secretion system protein VirB8 [Acidiphilium sp.]|jgi:type IV secretion system protein VirB8|uniref:type IV secretion system protein VirB8 n=1 Tax=Acidiphilium TaxID=522 RepID=UPI00259112D8|nr:type IV secretion system protein VirB8 [Acidiphilium sp.]
MGQNSGAVSLTSAMLDRHYKEVLSFQQATARSARLLSKGALVALAVSMLANAALGWAVASMLPLTKLVPVYFLIRPDGTIDDSVSLSTLPASTHQAVIRAALWQYVQMREGYSYDTARYRYDIVSGMSDAATKAAYQAWFNYPNPRSPQVTVGKKGVVTVEPISVALIGPGVAQVRYQRVLEAGMNTAVTTTWTATEQFEQVDTMPDAERLDDPGGIIITGYQNEEDTAP